MDFSLPVATGNALHFLARQGTKKGQPGYGLPPSVILPAVKNQAGVALDFLYWTVSASVTVTGTIWMPSGPLSSTWPA
jgi:hypothetical protein